MIEIRNVLKCSGEQYCFEVKKTEESAFWEYYKDSDIHICDKVKNTTFDKPELCFVFNLTSVIDVCDKNDDFVKHWKHFRFEDIMNNRLLPIWNNVMFMEKFNIPDDETYIPEYIEAIVLPVLKRPGDINRLYKGMAKRSTNPPIIYYKGSYKQAEELRRRFGTKDMYGENGLVSVIPSGRDVRDNQAYTRHDKNELYNYVSRWVLDSEGMPRLLNFDEIMDYYLIPAEVKMLNAYTIRCLDPNTIIYRNVYVKRNGEPEKKEYLQVCIHSKEFEFKLIQLLNKLGVWDVISVIKTETNNFNKEGALELRAESSSTLVYEKVVYLHASDEPVIPDALNIDLSERGMIGHILFLALAAYKNSHKWLYEINSNQFTFTIG